MNAVRCVLELEYRRGLKGMSLIETVATKELAEVRVARARASPLDAKFSPYLERCFYLFILEESCSS